MFIRSDNLFLRPAWPEDRDELARLGVPAVNDPFRAAGVQHPMVVTMPGIAGSRIVGTAGFLNRRGVREVRLWLAPAWRHLGLFDEAEEALAELAEHLPEPAGRDGESGGQMIAA